MLYNNELYRAFCEKNVRRFTEILGVYDADPNSYPDGKKYTNFEIILKSPGSASFIAKCIEFGEEFNVKYPSQNNKEYRYPIHRVIESECIENLKAVEDLLSIKDSNIKNKIQSPFVNVKDINGKNCLHLLAERTTNDNYNNLFPMMKILLSYGCNANSSDSQGKTPFSILVDKLENLTNKSEILNYFRNHANVTCGKSKLTETVSLSYFNKFDNEVFDVCFLNLMDLLRNGDLNMFEDKFPKLKASKETYKTNCEEFLKFAIQSSLINIIDLIITSAASKNVHDLMIEDNKTKIPPLFWAYKYGNLQIFSMFLLHPQISLYFGSLTLLHYFSDKFEVHDCESDIDSYEFTREMTRDEKKCLDYLLNSPRCDRDYLNKLDKAGYPAIYYSVKYGIDYMTIKLLEKGAYIGTVITNIRKSLLNDFLDSCITSNSRFHDDENFKLYVNFEFLRPPDKCNNNSEQIEIKIQNSSFEELHPPEDHKHYVTEMKPLRKLIGNANSERLIMHPVLASFVFLKWSKIRYLIHFNLILTLLYIFSFIPFVIINQQRKNEDEQSIYMLFYVASCTSLSMLIIREISQLILSPLRYIFSRSNWVDVAIIFTSIAILEDFCFLTDHHKRVLPTCIILLSMWEYFNLLGYLPLLSVSLHTKMFRKVFTTFFKSLAFYSVMIIGFALSFYTLQGSKFVSDSSKKQEKESKDNPSTDSRSDRYNNFYTVGHSIVKSFVMLTGELDASNIKLEGYTYSALFLMFMFIVTIVLYNLLNALAISDTQELKVDAKLIDLHQRVLTMHQSEEAIFNGFVGERFHAIGGFLKKFISMFPSTLKKGKISICPNAQHHFTYKIYDSKLHLNDEIMKDMCTLLLKKKEERAVDRKRMLKERTHEKLSCDLIKMKKVINSIQDRLSSSSPLN